MTRQRRSKNDGWTSAEIELGRVRYRTWNWVTSNPVHDSRSPTRAHARLFPRHDDSILDEQGIADDLRLAERAGWLAWSLLGVHCSDTGHDEAAIPLLSELASEPEPHWTEVLITYPDGTPVANVECDIELPDGQVHRGTTGPEGLIRIDGIQKAGSITINFPALHEALLDA